MKLILSGERPISWNQIYVSNHWSYRKIFSDQIHQAVKAALLIAGITKPTLFPYKVNITITAFFKGRVMDSSNIPAKIYEDGLKGILIKDDSPKYVGSVTTRSEKDEENPRVEIEITKDLIDN